MRTIYIDAYAGIAGDMMAGALFSLLSSAKGRESAERSFADELAKLPLGGYTAEFGDDVKGGIAGISFRVYDAGRGGGTPGSGKEHDRVLAEDVQHHHHHEHRNFHDIEKLFTDSTLDARVVRCCIRAFASLANAEAKVHGTTFDKIHFHEVGAVDSIVDIAGVFILMSLLKWPRVMSSSINVGSGLVKCAHGILPVPAPATAEILSGLPVYSAGEPMERTTPTGALLIKELAVGFSPMPPGRIVFAGYGTGKRDSKDIPNALRAVLIDSADEPEWDRDVCCQLEANIDDMPAQDYLPASDRLFEAGALDVWTEPIFMKKNRPAQKFCCLVPPEKRDEAAGIILRHTTTQGVRFHTVSRAKLFWTIDERETPLGRVRFKTARLGGTGGEDGEILRITPEHDDLRQIAADRGMSVGEVRAMLMGFQRAHGPLAGLGAEPHNKK